MKKQFSSWHLLPLLFLLIINNNCGQKDSAIRDEIKSQEILPTKALTRVDDPNTLTFGQIRLFSMETQKSCFIQMNSSNKARIWKERISYISSLFKNSVKKAKVLELKSFINAELFSTKQLDNFEIIIDTWVQDNKELFGSKNLGLILTTLNELTITNSESGELSEVAQFANPCPPCGPDPNSCSCSTQSDWCSGKCRTAACIVTNSGCGTFWLYDCNGRCGSTSLE